MDAARMSFCAAARGGCGADVYLCSAREARGRNDHPRRIDAARLSFCAVGGGGCGAVVFFCSAGQDAQLQRFASATLPVVMQHLEMVQALLAEASGAAPQGLAAAGVARPADPKGTK